MKAEVIHDQGLFDCARPHSCSEHHSVFYLLLKLTPIVNSRVQCGDR